MNMDEVLKDDEGVIGQEVERLRQTDLRNDSSSSIIEVLTPKMKMSGENAVEEEFDCGVLEEEFGRAVVGKAKGANPYF